MAPRSYVVVCWVFAVLFAICVALQYNDPDPVRWMAMYGAATVLAAVLPSARAYRWSRIAAYVVAAAAAVWAGYLLSRIWGQVLVSDIVEKMSEKGGAVEEEREFGGLAIVAVTLAVLARLRRRWRPTFV